jgi:hypothetical protein
VLQNSPQSSVGVRRRHCCRKQSTRT